jgi:outer membrane lipopolysaccharide assembly protein LptE/RlpB
MKASKTFPAALMVGFAVLLGGCGYHLGPAKPVILRDVETLAVQTFKNKTYEPRIEVLMADSLIKQLQLDGTYQIVSDERADAILYCTLDEVSRRQARAVRNNVLATQEFSLRLSVQYELIDRVTGRIIQTGTVNGDTSFFINNDLQTDERQAFVQAIQRVAVKITGELTEGF